MNQKNIISGNGQNGLYITGNTSIDNLVEGNYIGINIDGNAKLPNDQSGIRLSPLTEGSVTYGAPALNTIGGPEQDSSNIISGNDQNGIYIGQGAKGNHITGNLIGTDATGKNILGNLLNGVFIIDASKNVIGSLNPIVGRESKIGSQNIISGNGQNGIYIGHPISSGSNEVLATSNYIMGNFIGTDKSGTLDLGNFVDGIAIENSNNNSIISPHENGTVNKITSA